MAIEIERKFLVQDERWREQADAGTEIKQGYLIGAQQASVRVRLQGGKANLNIKSMTLGVRREEYEYPIPVDDARTMLASLCSEPIIEKIRYRVPFGGKCWEVDVFSGVNEGLIIAEIELTHEDEDFARPLWLGEEVSGDPRYYNTCLAKHPYKDWR